MRTVRIHFSDFPGPVNPQGIRSLLEREYHVQLDEQRPDYVFYSVFGNRFLDYPDAVRVFFTGENVHPDFNLCDYAFAFDWLTFEDRYCRCPNFLLYEEFQEICRSPFPQDAVREAESKTEFCNFLYSNANAHPFRDQLFQALSAYRRVDAAGPHLNNTGFTRGSPSLGVTGTQDKLAYQRRFRFTIAAENSSSPGYTTEKLIHAIGAGTIPIYWGDPEVGRHFNTRRMVNCHEYRSLSEIVARVAELDQNETLFRSLLAEPVFSEQTTPEGLRPEAILRQLRYILDQPRDQCRRRNNHVWGPRYEEQRRLEIAAARRKSLFERTAKAAARWMRSK